MKKLIFTPLLLITLLTSGCDKFSTQPNLEDESKNIPWKMITGKIAYSRIEMGGESTSYLFIIDGSSKRVKLVKKAERMQFYHLSWKTDGSVLTFSDYDENKNFWQIFNIRPDGRNLVNIHPANAHCSYPAWSIDGRLAYWYNNGWPHMFEIRIDGKMFFNKGSCDQSRPAWSPDGKFLVISMADTNSQGSLYKMSLLDTSVTPLLIAKGEWDEEIFHDPIYSPDGSKLAFMKYNSSTGDKSEIWIMSSDGSNPEKITSDNSDSYPAWSPDGQFIAFSRRAHGTSRIFVISLIDRSVTQVTEKDADYPTWLP